MTYLLHKPHSFYKAKTMRFSYAQLSLGRYDDAWDYLRRIYRTLCITMIGIMSFWVGLMEIATKAGIIEQLSRKLKPLIHFLFPNLPDNHPAATHITTNINANILGLGWAATPAGLNAMEELKNLEDDRRKYHLPGKVRAPGTASNEMCTFLIINISSLQLIPVNVIAYRSQYGSVNPAAIAGPALLATIASTAAGVVFCKVMDRKKVDF